MATMIGTTDAARLLGISRQRLHWYIARGRLAVAQRIGRIALLDPAVVAAFTRFPSGRPQNTR